MTGACGLDVVGLTAGYGDTCVIEDVTFTVPARGRVGVLGRNGVGKTTLLATLVGLTRRHAGRIWLGGNEITLMPTSRRARAGLGYVPQTRDVFRSLTVEENLRVGLKGRPVSALDEAYALFPRLYERRRHFASQLSGGEQQMLATARAILGQPSVLLLDEPLEGLAPVICDELMRSLDALSAKAGMTLVLVEQQIERALDFVETVMILDRGRIAWSGVAADLRRRDDVIETYLSIPHRH